jgi:LysM repeat protein
MFRLGRILLSAAAGILLPLAIVSSVSAQTHTVAPGDSLSYIANLYSVAINEIVQLNHIANPNLIFSGQKLDIPGGQGPQPSSSGETYRVQLGDTLGQIAARYGVSVDSLARANSIDNPSFIVEGQALVIPGAQASVPTPQANTVYIPPPPLQFPPMPHDPDIEAIIDEVAAAYGVDPNLVKAVATVESGWTEGAVSVTDARGVMQIMPGTALYLENDVFGYPLNYDTSAYDNIKMGVKYLEVLLNSTGGDEHLAVASYYQGLAPTQAGVFYPDTTDYVNMIFRVRDTYWPS